MKLNRSIRVIMLIGGVIVLYSSGCEKKRVEDKQKSLDMITVRTLGLAYLEENKLKEAEAEFLKLIEIAPEEALGYANLGLVYLRMGKFADAEKQVKEALTIESKNPEIRLILAEVYHQTQRVDEAVKELEKSLKYNPKHVKTLFKLAQLYARTSDIEALRRQEEYLSKVVVYMPANIVARLQLIEVLLRNGKTEPATMHMEEIRKQMPDLPKEAVDFYDKGLALMRASKAEEALVPTRIVHNFLKVTPLYQAGFIDLKGPGGALIGFPVLTFSQDISTQIVEQRAILEAIRFTDVTSSAGLDVVQKIQGEIPSSPESGAILAIADYDSDGDQDLYVASWNPNKSESSNYLFRNDFGHFVDISSEAGVKHPGKDMAAIFADYDNDGYLDLYMVNSVSNLLYGNVEEGKFTNVAEIAGVADTAFGYEAIFADFDHEGDLDLYLANATTNRLYRNNLDGTFTELSEKMGIAGGNIRSRDAAFGDFDEDGDLDLFVVNENASNILYTNLRQGHFKDITVTCGLTSDGGSGAVTVGDYNNDGFLDLFVTALKNGRYYLYRNKGDGTFEKDTRSKEMFRILQKIIGYDARFFDFDNDGFLDLLVVGQEIKKTKVGRGIRLFHNDGSGRFKDVSSLLPKDLTSGFKVAVADYNEDGDMDIFITGFNAGIRLLRNDGGNVNKYLKVRLVGLKTGSGKNNHFGIGAKLEVRAGDLYQKRVVTEPVTHFGLGHRLKADVVRIVWTNGVPQNLFLPGSDQDLVEQQVLKGSCAFLYTWDGQNYTFVTDILWRSALGMPLGIMGGTTAYAFPNSTHEHLKISGTRLKAKHGVYSIQITEELWETSYFDQVKLLAIDHPDSVDIYVDERFVAPPIPPLHIYTVSKKHIPVSATDEQGNDLLADIHEKDEVYISNLRPTRYQGITEMHDLILDLGDLSQSNQVVLFLNGWVFPTDASINVSISQSSHIKVVPPYLQVLDHNGRWKTVIENMSFPMGKNKMVVVDLTGKFFTDDYRIRIRTNMQIYWDYIFFSTDESKIPLRMTTLPPMWADIHYRGFSRLYRKSLYSPHWFDYNDISTDPHWLDLEGYYTRYGEVTSLLMESDDMYVIINAGDEVTVKFDATMAPDLKPGWSRDFIIYSDGWIKDGDLNTAFSKTVKPLPFHGMSRYPYGEEESYPSDEKHQQYLRKYNTRKVTVEKFRKLTLSLP